MPFRIRCDHCQRALEVKDALRGKRIKCPSCGQTMTAQPPDEPSSIAIPDSNDSRPTIFISYVAEDSDVVAVLVKALESAGFHAWHYQRDVLPGMDYLQATGDALERCRAVVLVISAAALGDPKQVHVEVVRAHECGKPFVPVLRGVTHDEFQRKQPSWRQALGSTTSIAIPKEGLATILPKIVAGLQQLCAPKGPGLKICPSCGSNWLEGAVGCMDCGFLQANAAGAEAAKPPLTCWNPNCGVANNSDETTCIRCGSRLGLLFGRYRIEGILEDSGTRIDYRAVDTRTQQHVVLKGVQSTNAAYLAKLANLLQEEVQLRRLLGRHPVLTRVYDVLQDDSSAYLVLEPVVGENMLQLLENSGQPFPLEMVVAWGKSLCEFLDRLHRLTPPQILKSLKPENLALSQDGNTVKIIDLSESVGWGAAQFRERIFTETYAAPEQIIGKPEPRSDLFALAGTLYHLVTGERPEGVYTGEDLERRLQDPACSIPGEQRRLFALIRKNLSDRPEDRTASARAFAEELSRSV